MSVRGQHWELCAVCGCVHAGGRVILSLFCLICIQFFLVFAPRSLSKLFLLLTEVTAAYAYKRLCRFLQETLLPLLWRDWPGIYVVVWLIECDFQFRLVVVMMIPRNTFFWLCQLGVWVFAFRFHSSWVKCAEAFMWYQSSDKISPSPSTWISMVSLFDFAPLACVPRFLWLHHNFSRTWPVQAPRGYTMCSAFCNTCIHLNQLDWGKSSNPSDNPLLYKSY